MEGYLALAKGAKGAAAAQLISDALAAPGVFVFSELLESPNVAELARNPAHASSLRLLELFAYGTFAEYAAEASNLPQLSPAQLKKLKQLSIVTLSQSSKVLPYDTLQTSLDIANIRDLEDLIIDTMYQSIIEGKLDQKHMCLRVTNAMGRDLKPGQSLQLLNSLTKWLETSDQILNAIDRQLESVIASDAAYLKEKEIRDKALENAKQDAAKIAAARSFHTDMDVENDEGRMQGKRSFKARGRKH
ncbi:COP9 signalosome complex subunit 7a [Rhizoclosmatium sp. JEL0117]|nr:COP9 signalosome complex subunit 7a [Rhizoclosmatium sp. JEL0117]